MSGDGVIHKHLPLLRPQPHGVVDTADASDTGTTHREGLCAYVCVCMCAVKGTGIYKPVDVHTA